MTILDIDSQRSLALGLSLPHAGLRDHVDRLGSRNADPFLDTEAAEVVHDFRNTLAAVSLLCEVMLQELPEDSPTREMGGKVRLACQDAQALCTRMLAPSADTRDFEERIDLSNLVTEMQALLTMCVPPVSALRFDLAANLPSLNFSPLAMRQLLINLVKNAGAALGDQPGTVTVSTGWIELDAASLPERSDCEGLPPGRHLCFAVADTGCGMDEETRVRLLGRTRTARTNGHGLGLASVRRIAAAHRAGILIESVVGAGTTVRVVFSNAAAGSPQEDPSSKCAERYHGKPAKKRTSPACLREGDC